MGYGAMQLAGPEVWGPPRDVDAAIAVLREAVASGVNHIDTSDYYGPHVTNQIIKRALHPYPAGLVIVTKLGARRGADKSWIPALSRKELIDGVHDNLRNLGLDTLDVVNLRVGGFSEPIGRIDRGTADCACRTEAPGVDSSHRSEQRHPQAIRRSSENDSRSSASRISTMWHTAMTMPSSMLSRARHRLCSLLPAGRLHAVAIIGTRSGGSFTQVTPMQVALAWLLQRSPNILLIPGTSSVEHLRENLRLQRCNFLRM